MQSFDKNGDGEISYQEAIAATYLKDREAFKNNTTIKEFNELKYFMSLRTYDMFEGCSSLESVELPPFMTELNSMTFFKCASLKDIQLPATLKTIGYNAFWGTGLREIVIPAGIESFGSACFKDCTHLTSFRTETPIKIGEIPESMFENCTSLAYVGDIEAESIGDRAFMNADLSDIALVTATNRYGDYTFYNTNIRYNHESSNGNRDFGLYCNSIGSHCFENCDSLRPETIYMSQECPPALGKDAFKLREGKIQLLRLGFHENYLYRYLEAGWDAYFETIKAGVEFVDVTINIGGGWD